MNSITFDSRPTLMWLVTGYLIEEPPCLIFTSAFDVVTRMLSIKFAGAAVHSLNMMASWNLTIEELPSVLVKVCAPEAVNWPVRNISKYTD